MKTLFLVQHECIYGDSSDVKVIGVYESKDLAEKAVAKLSLLPGFIKTPDGFSIDPYNLNESHWTDGFESSDL